MYGHELHGARRSRYDTGRTTADRCSAWSLLNVQQSRTRVFHLIRRNPLIIQYYADQSPAEMAPTRRPFGAAGNPIVGWGEERAPCKIAGTRFIWGERLR